MRRKRRSSRRLGRMGMVTIATNMAGRGTDILLGGNADFMARQDLVKRPSLARAVSKRQKVRNPSAWRRCGHGALSCTQSQEFETTQENWDAAVATH